MRPWSDVFNSSRDPCIWRLTGTLIGVISDVVSGVWCENGRVVLVDLTALFVTGAVVPAWGQLTGLRQLSCSSNYFTGSRFVCAFVLRHVQELFLHNSAACRACKFLTFQSIKLQTSPRFLSFLSFARSPPTPTPSLSLILTRSCHCPSSPRLTFRRFFVLCSLLRSDQQLTMFCSRRTRSRRRFPRKRSPQHKIDWPFSICHTILSLATCLVSSTSPSCQFFACTITS